MHSEPPIQFFCAICGQSLNADAEFGGSVIACPVCERSVPVPGRISSAEEDPKLLPAFSPEILSVEITFLCPGCDRHLVADARRGGDPFICPKCDTTGEVPNWVRAKTPPAQGHAAHLAHTPTLTPEEIAFLSEGPLEAFAATSR